MTTRETAVKVEVELSLPSSVAREAEASGFFEPGRLEALLREALSRQRVDRLFEAADRLAGLPLPPLTESEVAEEIQAARAERSRAHAGRR